jgi:hypothetical protein
MMANNAQTVVRRRASPDPDGESAPIAREVITQLSRE